jgi:basic membrane protein A and related proteins
MKTGFNLRIAIILCLLLSACGTAASPTATPAPKLKVAVIIPQGSENDKGFNEGTLKGARTAAEAAGLEFAYVSSQAVTDDERNIETLIKDGADMVIILSFLAGDTVREASKRHPDVKFVTDNIYFPGFGCAETATDCYAGPDGLTNVISLSFAEDEVGYLAGVLAGCMTKTDHVGTVGGIEIPPVARFIKGFQSGAKSVKPNIVTDNQYIPDFNDPATGKVVAQDFIRQGADVIFVAAGNTGNGALQAAKEANVMAIGVDVDQYLTYPEVKDVLLSSAKKNVDVSVSSAVTDFAAGKLSAGIREGSIANGGVGLAPYHDWDSKIPQNCKDMVKAAETAVKADRKITGATQ